MLLLGHQTSGMLLSLHFLNLIEKLLKRLTNQSVELITLISRNSLVFNVTQSIN